MQDATAVYGVSVDSRSRPAGQPDNKYDIDLGRTLDRVKSVQLGSIQLPDCRYAFGSTAQLQYAEPITITPNCRLFIEQTVTTLDKVTCLQTVSTHQVQILIPPTLNQIVAYGVGPPDTVTTAVDAGLHFGVTYYPLIGQQMSVVGAHFPQSLMTVPMPAPFPTHSGPVVSAATLVGPPYAPTLGTVFQYASGYITALLGGNPLTHDTRHIIPGTAWSYVYAPRPTLVELFTMLNACLNDLRGAATITGTVVGATNTGPIVITSGAAHGLSSGDQVVVVDVTGNTAANGTFIVTNTGLTTFTLDGSVGNGAYTGGGTFTSKQSLDIPVQFGFDDTTNTIIASAPTLSLETRTQKRTITATVLGTAGSLGAKLGFGNARLDPAARATVPPSILRTVQLRSGNYTPAELVAMLNSRMNPLVFSEESADTRTLRYTFPGGTNAEVVIPRGRYTGVQLAAFLTFYMSAAPGQVTVTYSDTTGRFTFTHDLGLVFGLRFAGANNVATATRLGFEAINYDGANTYTSVNRAVYGVAAGASFPSNTYLLSSDESQEHFTFDSGDALQFVADTGVNTPNVNAVWNPLFDCTTAADGFAASFLPGDVLFAKHPFRSGIVTDATNTAPIVVTTNVAHLLTTGDNVTVSCVQGNTAANGTWQVTVTGATTFSIDGSVGNGTFTVGTTGFFSSNSTDVAGVQVATNTYTVVVQSAWDASTGLGNPRGSAPVTLTLEPTVSIFSVLNAGTVHEALGVPSVGNRILLQSARRNVFQLLLAHPNSCPDNFGFPPIAYPPSANALQMFDSGAFPTYDPSCLCVPVSNSYTSPFCWNLLPPDYIIMLLSEPCGSRDIHTHSFKGETKPIFAKLYVTSPYLQISEQMLFSTFANFTRVNKVSVEFQNPDGTSVEFNGRSHNFSLLFTLFEATAEALCF
jgi:hypothetical protein